MAPSTKGVEYSVITFENWRQAVRPMWKWIEDYHWIPIINNPYGMIQYCGSDVFKRTLQFPIAASIDGKQIGWSLVYNISDTAIRVRGVYVLPEARGSGVGTGLYDFALSLWPAPWNKYVGYYDEKSLTLFSKTWNLKPMPGFDWRCRLIPGQSQAASEMSNKIILCYKDIVRTSNL